MNRDYHHSAYKAAGYREESKTRQVVMLYEGALRYVQQVRHAIEKNDIEARYNAITKACEILNGLQISLDFEQGGEIAKLLYDYYAGLDARLSSLHFKSDLTMCDSCIRHLTMMKEAWEEVEGKMQKDSSGNVVGVEIEIQKGIERIIRTESHAMGVEAPVILPVSPGEQGLNLSA